MLGPHKADSFVHISLFIRNLLRQVDFRSFVYNIIIYYSTVKKKEMEADKILTQLFKILAHINTISR